MLANMELDGIGAGVDHRVAFRRVVDQGRQAKGIAGVGVAPQAELPHRPHHPGRILRLHRDGVGGLAVRHHLGEFGHAAADGVARAPLVHLHRADGPARRGKPPDELVERVARAAGRRDRQPERLEHPRRLGDRKRKTGLHDRRPLFKAIGVDLPQHLDVHQRIADLHILASAGQQVDLVAFLHAARREPRQQRLRTAETPTKRTPFPAWCDFSHGLSSQSKYSTRPGRRPGKARLGCLGLAINSLLETHDGHPSPPSLPIHDIDWGYKDVQQRSSMRFRK